MCLHLHSPLSPFCLNYTVTMLPCIRPDIKDSAESTKKRNNCWVALSLILYIYRVVEEELLMGRSLDFTELSGGLDLESALIYDAVHLLAVALRQLRY